ncbi:MAG: universal stress protein [Euryarchaeota archaeon]|nr:universal stress protein [Euryarchaeota archaeon]
MRRILVGFDGSEGAENALNKAMMLCDEDGEIILLAVVPKPSDKSFIDQEVYEKLKKKAKNLIDTAIRDIGEHEFTITGLIEEGDIAAKIIDIASDLDCNLIVLGSRGSSEIGNYPLGSVANKVVQYARKPVMVVR